MLKLYRAAQPLILTLVKFASRFSPNLREVFTAREGLMDRWRAAKLGPNRIWFHVSSVGELEQVRPVLEMLGPQGYSLILSYFSSSVPRLVKDWSFVQHADYLPLDEPEAMHELVRLIGPRLLVLNRYDLWPNHLEAAREWQVPVVVVNASTPPLGLFGKFSLWARRALFRSISAWTFVDSVAAAAWEPYVIDRAKGLVTGNPRVDRALDRVEKALAEKRAAGKLQLWKKRAFCLVAGSTWDGDEAVLLEAWKGLAKERSLVIVPHEPDEAHLAPLETSLRANGFSFVRFSQLAEPSDADVLVVDQRGFLAELYGLGQLAYVGGGFKREIHSIIEPVAHGLPVAFGPLFRRSPEAVTLKATGAALALPKKGGATVLRGWIERMGAEGEERWRAGEALRVFLQIHRGAGERVAKFLRLCLGDIANVRDESLAFTAPNGILPERERSER